MTQNEHVYAIYCRPEVAGDVISGENVKVVKFYAALNFADASIGSFRKNKISHLRIAKTTAGPLQRHFRGQGAKIV